MSDLEADAGLDRVLLGGQAEGVEADGVQDVESAHALVAGDDVGRGVVDSRFHQKQFDVPPTR